MREEYDMADSRAANVLGHLHHLLCSAAAPTEDGRLLERFVHKRDEEAFAELVARHGPLVLGLCRRLLGNLQDAEDVFQATFFVLARKAATIRKPESLSCWLHGVASRLAMKARAESQRRHSLERQAAAVPESAEVDLSWREVRGLIDEELQRLPEKQRLPLVLCYLEGLTQDEASRRLGWPRGTLKRRLEAGRERLRLRLTRRGVTLGAGLFAVALTESASRAVVPIMLRSATVRTSMEFLTHKTAAVAVTPAALLVQGALQTMMTTKLKFGAVLILMLGCVVTAAGLALRQAPPQKKPENKVETATPSRAVEKEQARKDRYGDPLPPGAIARLGTLRLRHQEFVRSLVFSRDGKMAIAGDAQGNIVVWDVATGREVRHVQRSPGYTPEALALSADGKMLAGGGSGPGGKAHIYLWDIETNKFLSQHELDTREGVQDILFAPDDKTLIVGHFNNVIRVWDVASKKVKHELKWPKGMLGGMALSPDGKTLASGSWEDPNIRLWDLAGGKEKLHFKAHDTLVMRLAYSPDGKTIVSYGGTGTFVFSDANTGKQLRKVTDNRGALQSFAFAPDGKTLFCVEYDGVRIRDAVSGKQLRRLAVPGHFMNRLAFSPDGKTLATFGGGPMTFDVWDIASGKLLHPAPGHRSRITSLVFSADGRQVFSVAGICDLPVQAWDMRTGERLYELGNDPNSANRLALSPDGKLLAASSYSEREIKNGYIYEAIRLWDPASRKEVRRCVGHKNGINARSTGDITINWSADGKTLVSSSVDDQTIQLWDAATGKQLRVIDTKQRWPAAAVLSPDGKIAAAGGYQDGTIHSWSVETGKEQRSIKASPNIVTSLAFSPDGSILASNGAPGAISLWEPATGRLLHQLDTKTSRTGELAFSHDGRTLLSGHDDGSVRLWEVATQKERACFMGHRGGVRAVAISRDGRRIASGSEDTTILVWDATVGASPNAAQTPEQLQTLWRDLIDTDAGRAYRAIWQITLTPKRALPFLAERLPPVAPLGAEQQKRTDHLLSDLDSDRFAVRQEAEAELEKMGSMIEPALHKALESKPSLEMRRRIEAVLAKLANERLRTLRALEAIEHMSNPEARQFLDKLANGMPRAWLTEEAAAIRRRLAKQPVAIPQR
jgi:RNA polymerase sigma factor (sigma-70 family)